MRSEMFSYSQKVTSVSLYDELPEEERKHIDSFKEYLLGSASEDRVKGAIAEVLRFRKITGISLFETKIEDLRYFLKELRSANFSDHSKNKIKAHLQRFLKFTFKDWSERFSNLDDIKFNTDAQNKKPISDKDMLNDEDIFRLLEAEKSLFWKTFLIVQFEGALRTGEVRSLEWKNIYFEDDGFTILKIPSKKNRNASIKVNDVILDKSTEFLKRLKEEQQKLEIKTIYVFPSPSNPNKHISKGCNLWFSKLTKEVLGRSCNNYLLRHSKASKLKEKVLNGELSKDNATTFMRHSEKMFDKIYSHVSNDKIKQLMKKQIYDTKEIYTKDEKIIISQIQKENLELKKQMELIQNKIDGFYNFFEKNFRVQKEKLIILNGE